MYASNDERGAQAFSLRLPPDLSKALREARRRTSAARAPNCVSSSGGRLRPTRRANRDLEPPSPLPTSRRIADRHGLSRPEARTRRRPRREESRAAGAHGRRRQDRRRAPRTSGTGERRALLDQARVAAGLPDTDTIDAQRRVLGVNRVELVQGLQRCHAPDCDAVPTTSTGSCWSTSRDGTVPPTFTSPRRATWDDLGCGVRLLGERRARPARSGRRGPRAAPPNPTVPSNRRARPTATLTPARTSSTSAASASSWSIARRLHRRRATGRVIQLRKGRLLHEVAVWAASAARSPRDAHASRIGPTCSRQRRDRDAEKGVVEEAQPASRSAATCRP